jgi:hypothetical protein
LEKILSKLGYLKQRQLAARAIHVLVVGVNVGQAIHAPVVVVSADQAIIALVNNI